MIGPDHPWRRHNPLPGDPLTLVDWIEEVERQRAFPCYETLLPEIQVKIPCATERLAHEQLHKDEPVRAPRGTRKPPSPCVYPRGHVLSVECPKCHATPSHPCRNESGTTHAHSERDKVAWEIRDEDGWTPIRIRRGKF